MQLIQQEKPVAEIHVMSFSWLAIENIRKIDPQQKTVALLHDTFSFAMRRFTSAQSIGPGITAFRKKPHLNQDPRKLFVWTVDDADDMRFCADNGVDVLITNTPSYARSVLGYN
jgi:glycerophosphoryl diester phosphodiesterase